MTFEEFQEYIKKEIPKENCPVSKTLELLGGKWTSRVIYELEKADQLRFGQLKIIWRELPIPCSPARSKS